jgi:hypothetical protein
LLLEIASAFGDLAFNLLPGQERLARRNNPFSDSQ